MLLPMLPADFDLRSFCRASVFDIDVCSSRFRLSSDIGLSVKSRSDFSHSVRSSK